MVKDGGADAPVYLDYNATAPVRPVAAEAMAAALALTGNASSVHGFGRRARAVIEDAREQVAALAGARPADVVFTSGGTEANALALAGLAHAIVLVSAVEHDSVLEAVPDARVVPVDADGRVDPAVLDDALGRLEGPALVSVMLANNETGVVQAIPELAEVARRHGATFHCDAVQVAGKLPLDVRALGVHAVSLSAHKLGGPQGIGALIVSDEVAVTPIQRGGGQERRRRAGTENLAGIAGFGAAAAAARLELPAAARLADRRDDIERRVIAAAPEAVIAGAGAARLPNTSCIAMPGVASETQVMALDLAGVAVSAGSACSSGKVAPSHVLRAMGLPEGVAASAIRVSLGWRSQAADADRFVAAWRALYTDQRVSRRAAP